MVCRRSRRRRSHCFGAHDQRVVEICASRRVREADGRFRIERLQRRPPEQIVDIAALTRLNEQPYGEEDPAVTCRHIYHWSQLPELNKIVMLRSGDLLVETKLLLTNNKKYDRLAEDLFYSIPIRLEGD